MLPKGIEPRPDLQLKSGVLAFGFPGAVVKELAFRDALADGGLLEHINSVANRTSIGFVVLDLRNVESICSIGIGRLLVFHRNLDQIRCKLVLLISDPVLRSVFSDIKLDQRLFLAADEAELRDFL